MAMPSMDPRTGGGCVTFMANKFFSYVVGLIQLIIWTIGFLTLVFSPSSLGSVVQHADTTSMVIAGFLSLFCIAFAVILLLGLYKDRRTYIKIYCFWVVVYLFLIAFSIIVNIFLQPEKMGFRGFFSMVISFLLNVFFLFVVRCYYLLTYCNGSHERMSYQPKM